jgi:hypothetical protein
VTASLLVGSVPGGYLGVKLSARPTTPALPERQASTRFVR